MFNPLYLYSLRPTFLEEYLLAKGFTLMDVDDPASSIPKCNPSVIVYDGGLPILDGVPNGGMLMPPKSTGVVCLTSARRTAGHIHGLPHPEEFLKWFFDEQIVYWNPERGNFRTGLVQHFDACIVG